MTRKITINTIAAPEGMTGIAVAPWSDTEVYAVAADWAQASSPIMTYGGDGWDYSGRQVADYQHSPRAALRAEIRDSIMISEGISAEEVDDDDLDAIMSEATDLRSCDLVAMATMLDGHGDRFSGSCADDAAQEWLDADFDSRTADEWCEIGVWDATTAESLRDAGLTPADVTRAAAALVEDMDDEERADAYTDGSPIYSACNGDTDVAEIIDAAR